MKTLRTLMIAATAGLMLTGCNKDDGADTAISHFPEDGVIRVTTNVNEAVLTRAGLTSTNLSNFWLKIVTGDGNVGYNYFEKITKTNSGEWESANSMLWKDATTLTHMTAAVFGDHNFTDEELSHGFELTLPADQSAEDGSGIVAADLLAMRETTVNPAEDLGNDGKVSITLSHALTKIDVTLTLGNEFAKSGLNKATDLTDFEVSSKGSFFFDAREGFVYASSNNADVDVKAYRNSFTQAEKSVANYECIVVPYLQTKLTVSFKIGDKPYSWTSAEVQLVQGYKYAIALTVGADAVTVAQDGITASPWTPQSGTPTQHSLTI
ncbi:MAG: fimbrillin family protein [Bacteroidales bacterium]|nr:fimbrillin family protein [Bacteroidales bacterium]